MASWKARDTDADWRRIGEDEPFWGVLSDERFRSDRLDAQAVQDFYASGEFDIGRTCERTSAALGSWPTLERALDFGCGAGRLTYAMAARAGRVVGYDVSPAMLELARERAPDGCSFTGDWPEGGFDWINSWIVFQHIEPQRGMALIDALLGQLEPDGLITLQVTLYRNEAVLSPQRGLKRVIVHLTEAAKHRTAPPGAVTMYDYDFTALAALLHRHGLPDFATFHTEHGAHHGVQIIGRKRGAG